MFNLDEEFYYKKIGEKQKSWGHKKLRIQKKQYYEKEEKEKDKKCSTM